MNKTNPWKASTVVLAGALAFVLASPDGGINEATAEKQPRMRAALHNLKQAENQLSKASHDKGGHRVAALAATRAAIAQVKEGIKHDNRN